MNIFDFNRFDAQNEFLNSALCKFVLARIVEGRDPKDLSEVLIIAYNVINGICRRLKDLEICAKYFELPYDVQYYDKRGINYIDFFDYHYSKFLSCMSSLSDLFDKLILVSYGYDIHNNWSTVKLNLKLDQEVLDLHTKFIKKNKQYISKERNMSEHEGIVKMGNPNLEISETIRSLVKDPHINDGKIHAQSGILIFKEKITIFNLITDKLKDASETFKSLSTIIFPIFAKTIEKHDSLQKFPNRT